MMNQMSKAYRFDQQGLVGAQGEQILDEWLSESYKILNVSDIKLYQESGIDRILMRPDGTTVKVEYKFDLASSRTGNLFFETVSVDRRNVPGWGWSSQADYWIFLLPSMEVLVVEPSRLRTLAWQYREKLVDKEIQNLGYKTIGIAIPLKQVRAIARCVKELCQQELLAAV
ncbi:MAG: hypothetical protein AAFU78_21155 [Cyanobacteria bacterium J06633_2]